jgi:hypothetical protein
LVASHPPGLADKETSVSLTGVKEGALYHQNINSFTNVVPIIGFNFSGTSPRDPATGQATGKQYFTPVMVSKATIIPSSDDE